MLVVLLTLALWPVAHAADDKVGPVDALCNAVNVPMLCGRLNDIFDFYS